MRIMWFCIPAHGHTNPTVEVVRALTARGHSVRYYSFEAFREKLEGAGAEVIPLDNFLPPLDARGERRMRRVSTTEMSVKSFETTARLDATLAADVAAFAPDILVSDSACFWGKLTAKKHGLPLVVSTTTFAFNQASSQYMKYSFRELADMVLGLPRLNRAMAKLRPLGYRVKSALDIVQNGNDTDTIVYTSAGFQPCAETFDPAHYRFVGPSVRKVPMGDRTGRPLVYISLGTVINDRPGFYRHCLDALRDEPVDVLISCGEAFDPATLDPLPANARVERSVDQLEVLSRASLFITHCGMNSASEGLYMAVPELLVPLSGEQRAVARRVAEVGAGRLLDQADAAGPEGIRRAVRTALDDADLAGAAQRMREAFLGCSGPEGAADFIEQCADRARVATPAEG